LIISYSDFIKKESYYQQIICADNINFDVVDIRGNIISEQMLLKGLENAGISFVNNKATIVHGKFAAIVGVILKYLGNRSVAVVLENTEGFVSTKKVKRTSTLKTEEFDPASIPNSRSLPFVDPGKVSNPKPEVEDQSRSICSCFIF
jgi:hypothetical protein